MAEIGQPVRESFRVLGVYVRGQILLCLCLTLLYAAAFGAMQVRYWYLIGAIGGAAAVIPRIGSLLPLFLAVLALEWAGAPLKSYLILLGLWLGIQAIEFLVLIPRLISRPLGLREWPVLVALLVGSLFFGPFGLLLAVPVLAIGLVFWRHLRKSSERQ